MNISLMRLRGVILEIRSLTAAVNRLCDLKELEMQSAGITTRTEPARKEDILQTHVAYVNPEFTEFVAQMEREAGRPLSDEEQQRIMAAMADESGE